MQNKHGAVLFLTPSERHGAFIDHPDITEIMPSMTSLATAWHRSRPSPPLPSLSDSRRPPFRDAHRAARPVSSTSVTAHTALSRSGVTNALSPPNRPERPRLTFWETRVTGANTNRY